MKYFSITLLLMATFPVCFGQSSGYKDFIGFLRTSDGQVINFKLMIGEIKGRTFKGYSATNYNSSDYTKSIIEGEIDLKENKMSFKEISNTETKSTAEDSTFCYITASNLTIQISDKKNILKGKFEGLFPSGKVCATGVLMLVNGDVLNDSIIENEPKLNQTACAKIEAKDSTIADSVFTSNEVLLVNEWKTGLAIEVWDGDHQDNDEIAIYLNDKLQRKVVLMHKKTVINLLAKGDKFRLKIVALNEGRSGKNTLNFRLKNASTNKDYASELKKGESFAIDFRKSD